MTIYLYITTPIISKLPQGVSKKKPENIKLVLQILMFSGF